MEQTAEQLPGLVRQRVNHGIARLTRRHCGVVLTLFASSAWSDQVSNLGHDRHVVPISETHLHAQTSPHINTLALFDVECDASMLSLASGKLPLGKLPAAMAATHPPTRRLENAIEAFMVGDATVDAVYTAFQENSPDPTRSAVVCRVDGSAASWARLTQLHDSSFGHGLFAILRVIGMGFGILCTEHCAVVQ